MVVGMQDDRARGHGTGQAAASYLVHAGDVHEPETPKGVLDVPSRGDFAQGVRHPGAIGRARERD